MIYYILYMIYDILYIIYDILHMVISIICVDMYGLHTYSLTPGPTAPSCGPCGHTDDGLDIQSLLDSSTQILDSSTYIPSGNLT